VRLVVADDSAIVRDGLRHVLEAHGYEIAATASDGDELIAAVEITRPDVALIDIRMPPTHTTEGLAAAAAIRERAPAVGVLVLSQYIDTTYVLRLLEEGDGYRGYLLKDRVTDARELIAALQRVAAGELVVDRELVDALLSRRRDRNPLDSLTERERDVLALMAEGLTDRGIATRLWITPNTVETHVRHILRKLALPEDATSNRRVHAVLTYLRT
jgi:DNA-binding NarL/FixJ family response regulator